ncbi:MAG: metallophosphoesterase [Muribaculaceae bacterium]|nr:metallophosphoesterase [Muribaculaceae bacterium]
MNNQTNNTLKIAIISDLHVMSPELLVNDGQAFEEYLNRDRKMLRESAEILETLVGDILDIHPQIVLVTGDLTKDGELKSHRLVAQQLKRLIDAGIQVLVTPGNHDINNPDARIYDGDTATPAETITRNQFAEIYKEMGYDSQSRRDPDTLSYCRDVTDNFTILSIDACMDRLNTFVSRGDARDHCKTSGRLESSTQQWLVKQAAQATADGKRVIAMMHHHLVPHFHMEEMLAAPYMVDNAGVFCQQLIEAGVHVIFTGHLHISDISQTTQRHGNMVEIATAAAVGYPCQWRIANCNIPGGKLQLRSCTLHSLPSDPDFGEHARETFSQCIPSMTYGVLNRYWPEISQAISNYSDKHAFMMRYVNLPDSPQAMGDLLLKHLKEPVTKAYIAFAEGNEGGFDNRVLIEQLINGIDNIVNETARGIIKPLAKAALRLRFYSIFRLVLRSILEDLNEIGTKHEATINDHTAIIKL